MERCKTCRHWSRFRDDEHGALDGAGKCEKTPQLWDVAEPYDSGHWESRMRLLPQHAGVLAAAEDGSGYSARLVTMPDFGCVQHEEKMSAEVYAATHWPDGSRR